MTKKVRVGVYSATITLYEELEDDADTEGIEDGAPENAELAAAIEDGIDDVLGFASNATVTRTDK